MKKFISTIAAIAIAAGAAFAQDMAQITETYNAGATALADGDKAAALSSFEQALELAKALGEEGQEIASKCEGIIPGVMLSISKDLIKAGEYDSAIENLKAASAAADKYGAFDVMGEAEGLIPQVLKTKGGKLLNAKDYAGAAEAYKAALECDPTDGTSALRLGAALNAAGDLEGALAAFDTAAANGQKAAVDKQLTTIFLKKAATALKEKKYADAIAAACKVNEIADNAQAYQIAGQASQLAGKNADAIKYLEKYLEVAPTAKNAGQIAYTVGALYQTSKNNAKAKEFYTKALSDPTYGPEAKKMLDAIK